MRKVGAWAEEAERADAEAAAKAASGAGAAAPEAFPSLGEAAAAGSRKQKKKPQTFSLAELTTGKAIGPGMRNRGGPVMSESRGLTPEEMMMLPTGPRERSEEELQHYGGLGGGFKSYGGGGGGGGFHRGGFRGDHDGRFDDRSNYGGGGGYDRREPRESSDRDMPSRADEADTWARGKMTPAPPHSGYDDDRRREQRISDRDMPSRADEVEDWASAKKFVPDQRYRAQDDRRGRGYDRGYDNTEDWASGRRYTPAGGMDRWPRRDSMPLGDDAPQTERPRLVLQPRSAPSTDPEAKKEDAPAKPAKASPFGAARPREDVLAEKGQDWKKLEEELETKATLSGGQSSAHSSRQGTPDYSKPRVKVDPFGNAKPREVLLQERGQDYRKMDFEIEHKAINRAETEQERQLKEEIKIMAEQLEQESSMNGLAVQHEGDMSLKDLLAQKELDLVRLTRELDDKIRFAQKSGRPSSRSGSEYGDGERPPSRRGPRDRPQSGLSDAGSHYEAASAGAWGAERPLSRSSSRDLDGNRYYQDRPPSRESLGGGSRGSRDGRADTWVADGRPPSRTGSRDVYRRNGGRPPSRDYVTDSSQMTAAAAPTRGADIWRRPPERATSRCSSGGGGGGSYVAKFESRLRRGS